MADGLFLVSKKHLCFVWGAEEMHEHQVNLPFGLKAWGVTGLKLVFVVTFLAWKHEAAAHSTPENLAATPISSKASGVSFPQENTENLAPPPQTFFMHYANSANVSNVPCSRQQIFSYIVSDPYCFHSCFFLITVTLWIWSNKSANNNGLKCRCFREKICRRPKSTLEKFAEVA